MHVYRQARQRRAAGSYPALDGIQPDASWLHTLVHLDIKHTAREGTCHPWVMSYRRGGPRQDTGFGLVIWQT